MLMSLQNCSQNLQSYCSFLQVRCDDDMGKSHWSVTCSLPPGWSLPVHLSLHFHDDLEHCALLPATSMCFQLGWSRTALSAAPSTWLLLNQHHRVYRAVPGQLGLLLQCRNSVKRPGWEPSDRLCHLIQNTLSPYSVSALLPSCCSSGLEQVLCCLMAYSGTRTAKLGAACLSPAAVWVFCAWTTACWARASPPACCCYPALMSPPAGILLLAWRALLQIHSCASHEGLAGDFNYFSHSGIHRKCAKSY